MNDHNEMVVLGYLEDSFALAFVFSWIRLFYR